MIAPFLFPDTSPQEPSVPATVLTVFSRPADAGVILALPATVLGIPSFLSFSRFPASQPCVFDYLFVIYSLMWWTSSAVNFLTKGV